jgi:RNA polymerase sigma factor (sigma-70 family)
VTVDAVSDGPHRFDGFHRGDPAGLSRVYDEFGGLVYGSAFRVLREHGLAEEATQETFVRAWMNAASFDVSRPMAPWLSVMAKRVALDILRRETLRTHKDLVDVPESLMADSLLLFDDSWLVRYALETLPEPDRDLIRMIYFDDKPAEDVATLLAIPVGTVKSRAHTARQKLLRVLAAINEEPLGEQAREVRGQHG